MQVEVLPEAGAAARWAASFIARRAHEAVRERGRFLLALSGGESPLPMFEALSRESLPWQHIEIFQADERAAPRGSTARNWTQIERLLLDPVGLPARQRHPMPADAHDLEVAAADYTETLLQHAGTPPVLDLIHLGLGSDGHTASLFPGDAALDSDNLWVSATAAHNGYRRMTLTLPGLARARCILWLVCGAGKADMLARLAQGDETIPSGRVPRDQAWIATDTAAASRLARTARLQTPDRPP